MQTTLQTLSQQADAEKAEAEAAAKFQAEVERAAREKEAGLDSEPPDDSRQLRNQVRAPLGGVSGLRVAATWVDPALGSRSSPDKPQP